MKQTIITALECHSDFGRVGVLAKRIALLLQELGDRVYVAT